MERKELKAGYRAVETLNTMLMAFKEDKHMEELDFMLRYEVKVNTFEDEQDKVRSQLTIFDRKEFDIIFVAKVHDVLAEDRRNREREKERSKHETDKHA